VLQVYSLEPQRPENWKSYRQECVELRHDHQPWTSTLKGSPVRTAPLSGYRFAGWLAQSRLPPQGVQQVIAVGGRITDRTLTVMSAVWDSMPLHNSIIFTLISYSFPLILTFIVTDLHIFPFSTLKRTFEIANVVENISVDANNQCVNLNRPYEI
jgi:hypothetical protein